MAALVPALQRIQHQYGYLKREALEQLSKDTGVPLYRLHSVASFFPHFALTPPAPITLRVCRDMACHLAGSRRMLRHLRSLAGEQLAVQRVSCLGRCDRAPAACVAAVGAEHDYYYLGRSEDDLSEIVDAFLRGERPTPDLDETQPYSSAKWMIDPYSGPSDYAAVLKAIDLRNTALSSAARLLTSSFGFNAGEVERFRQHCLQSREAPADQKVAAAVRAWRTGHDWAKTPELSDWSETLLAEMNAADLRGLGGAGIPAIQKWRDVRDAIRTAFRRNADTRGYIVVNGDESEPGTFKDRELLLRTPHVVLEGVILAGLITDATEGFIYIRHEYEEQIEACRREIRRTEDLGLCGEAASVLGRPFPVSVFVSPGGYICGEQSALIEAMSDRRGEPRNMPPKLETNGLYDMPTLVSNVETYSWVPYIIVNSGKTYAGLGVNGWKGRRFFSISGDVKRPGVYEVPMGLTLRELVYGDEYCGGIVNDRPLKGFAPSGPSGGFLPAKLTTQAGLPRDHTNNKSWQAIASRRGFDPNAEEFDILDLELELNLFRALSPTQALGAGLVVYAEGRDMAEQALNSVEFFRNESCGKCVPCRIGSQKMVSLTSSLITGEISKERWSNELLPLLAETGKAIELASICGLGRSVPVPLRTAINYFNADIAKHLGKHSSRPARAALV